MTQARREAILVAARGLGAEDFNRLVESAGMSRYVGRLRYWQEELLGRLAGVAPVSFAEFVEAFDGAKRMPVPRSAAKSDANGAPEPDLRHPRLGEMYRDEEEECWQGAIRLPRFAAAGQSQRDEELPAGNVRVSIHDPDGIGISAQQDAAITWLLKHEAKVFDAVCCELASAMESDEPAKEFVCTEVEVSRLHLGGVAYLGFNIADVDPEHGFQIVYHPKKDPWCGDWEALNDIEEADNL